MRLGWILPAALVAAATPATAQSVKAGIEAWSRSDYAGALVIWRPLAAAGDPDAMFNLGQAYRLGRGVPVQLSDAVSWYSRAANAGFVDAQAELGILLFQNGNQLSGLRWLRAAAEKGDPRAELLYGTALYNGDGLVRRDPELARSFVARAAAQGLAPATKTLAQIDQEMPALARHRPSTGAAAGRIPVTTSAPQRPAPPARAVVAGSWRVQLGAFGRRSAAEALFGRLAAGPLAGKQPIFIPIGAMTRLQAGPFASKAAATTACAALLGRGQPCFAVPGG